MLCEEGLKSREEQPENDVEERDCGGCGHDQFQVGENPKEEQSTPELTRWDEHSVRDPDRFGDESLKRVARGGLSDLGEGDGRRGGDDEHGGEDKDRVLGGPVGGSRRGEKGCEYREERVASGMDKRGTDSKVSCHAKRAIKGRRMRGVTTILAMTATNTVLVSPGLWTSGCCLAASSLIAFLVGSRRNALNHRLSFAGWVMLRGGSIRAGAGV